jgi:hypothetical protein
MRSGYIRTIGILLRFVPAVFADHNAQARKTPKPKTTSKTTRG